MAARNINVVISANVRKYTDGLRRAQTATQKFQSQVTTNARAVAGAGQASQRASSQSNRHAQALHGVARGAGRAAAEQNHYSAAIHRGNRAMGKAQAQTGLWAKSTTFLKSALIQSVAALGGFALLHTVINGVRKAFTFMIDSVMEFDTAITESMAIASEYGPGVRKQFEEAARAQSKLSAFSPAELAEGYYQLLSAGLDTNAAIQSTAVVANFAQAGVMELEQASELAAQSTAALGMATGDTGQRVENMTRVTDVLVTAALKSTATVEEFAEAMTNKFGTAVSLAGRDVEEATSILMAYARVGIKGRLAGTQASIFLRDIQKAAINNADAMSQLGIEVFDASGNMNDLVTIGKQMNESLGGMDSKNLRVTLKQLGFADRAVHSILPIIATGAKTWDEYADATANAGGASQKIAERQLKSIANQISLVKQGLSTLAEQAGRNVLVAISSLWASFKEPINAIYQQALKVGRELINAFKPTALVVGAMLLPALHGAAQALKVMSTILGVISPAIAPFVTLASVVWTVNKAMTIASGVAAMYQAVMARVGAAATASSAQIVLAKNAKQALMVTQAQGMAVMHAYAAQQKAAAAATAGAWLGSNGKIMLSLAALKSRVLALGATMKAFVLANPWLVVAASIAAAFAALVKFRNEARKLGQEQTDSIRNEFNMESFDDRAASAEAERKRIEALANAYADGAGEASNFIQTAANNKAAEEAIIKQLEELEKLVAENEKLEKAIQKIADTSGVSFEVAARRVQDAGLTDALIEGKEGSEKYDDAIKQATDSLDGAASAAARAGLSSKEMAGMNSEAVDEMIEDASELEEAFVEVFSGLIDPQAIIDQILETNEAIKSAFGETLSSIGEGLSESLEEIAANKGDKAFESYQEGLEAQIKALEDRKDALDPPRGAETSDAEKDRIDARKESIDDEIEALREGKKAREEFNSPAGKVTLDLFAGSLDANAQKARNLTDSLLTLRERLRNTGMDETMVSSVVTQFAEMGPEAQPLIDEFIGLTEEKFAAMATRVADSIAAMNPEIKMTLNDMIAGQQAALQDVTALREGYLNFAGQNAVEGGLSVQEIQQFASLGEEYARMIPEMSNQIAQAAASGGQAAADAKVKELADVVKTRLSLSDFGQGAIPTAILQAMEETQTIMGSKTGDSVAEMQRALNDSKGNLVNAFGQAGLESAEAWHTNLTLRLLELAATNPFDPTMGFAALGRDTKGNKLPDHLIGDYKGAADGAIVEFANGGFSENHTPQITRAKAGTVRVWSEPETGGEAYIPMGANKRGKALPIMAEVARRFGYAMTKYADGGISTPGAAMVGGGQWGTPQSSVQVLPVPVPVESQNVTNFNGPIQGVKMEDAERYAARKRRQSRLAGAKR